MFKYSLDGHNAVSSQLALTNHKQARCNGEKYSLGFTLIELMITIAVASALLALTIPSFSGLLSRNDLVTETNNFAANFNLARAEALNRSQTVSVVAKGGDWANGYQLQLAATSEILRDISPTGNTIAPIESSSLTTVSFRNMGMLAGASPSFRLCKASATEGRTISITATGRINTAVLNPCP